MHTDFVAWEKLACGQHIAGVFLSRFPSPSCCHQYLIRKQSDKPNHSSKRDFQEIFGPEIKKGCWCLDVPWCPAVILVGNLVTKGCAKVMGQEPYPLGPPTRKFLSNLRWTILIRSIHRSAINTSCFKGVFIFLAGPAFFTGKAKRMFPTCSYWRHFLEHRAVHGNSLAYSRF